MDRILDYINKKTNNKYKNLLFFDALYNVKNDSIELSFKIANEENCIVDVEELTKLCKEFLNMNFSNFKVVFKKENMTMDDFKNYVKERISKTGQLDFVNLSLVKFDFQKNLTNIIIQYDVNAVDISKIEDTARRLEFEISEDTNMSVKIIFEQLESQSADLLQIRKQRIQEDNKIYEQFKKSQIVNFKVVKNIYNSVNASNAFIAGSNDIDSGQVAIVGRVKNFSEKIMKSKVEENADEVVNQRKYYVIELENDGLATNCVLFPKKDEVLSNIAIGESLAIEGKVSEFKSEKNVRVSAICTCEYEPPKPVWRSVPSMYRFVKPEPYEFFEQSNFFSMQKETDKEYLKNNSFVIYDLETTGLSSEIHKIIDIGAFKVVNGKITEKFSTFVNPLCHIPEEASKINRITDEMVKNSPTIEEALPDFYKFCDGSIILGYNNIGFDDLFIKKEGKKQLYNFDNERNDVKLLAENFIKGLKNYKLGTVCAEMGVQLVDAHRAINDALATSKLFIKIIEKFY